MCIRHRFCPLLKQRLAGAPDLRARACEVLMRVAAPRGIAKFDSAPAMLQALARYLAGSDFPGLGLVPQRLAALGRLIDTLPDRIREEIYTWSGWWEAISPRRLRDLSAEDVSRWLVAPYPERRFPAVAIGSSNGA